MTSRTQRQGLGHGFSASFRDDRHDASCLRCVLFARVMIQTAGAVSVVFVQSMLPKRFLPIAPLRQPTGRPVVARVPCGVHCRTVREPVHHFSQFWWCLTAPRMSVSPARAARRLSDRVPAPPPPPAWISPPRSAPDGSPRFVCARAPRSCGAPWRRRPHAAARGAWAGSRHRRQRISRSSSGPTTTMKARPRPTTRRARRSSRGR
jgi:hypothetical protein